jgi:DNA replication protein DnaC
MRRLSEVLPTTATSAGSTDKSSSSASRADRLPYPPLSDEAACPDCRGARFLRRNLPLDHPEFGQLVPCHCVGQVTEEDRAQRLLRYSNIGALTRLTFDNLIDRGRSPDARSQEVYRRCVEDARAFAERPDGWLVLSGASGCGKTHIAAAAANRILERGEPALFMVVPDLLDHLRAAYNPNAEMGYDELSDRVRNAPVLVLDDLGAQSATAWAQEKLFQIINHRFNARLPTIVTTNLAPEQLDERLRSRLTDTATARVYALEQRRPSELRALDVLDHPLIREMTFARFDVRSAHLAPEDRRRVEDAYRHAMAYAERPDGWLLFMGPHGSGKTHLAAAIANDRRRRGEGVVFMKVPKLLEFLRRRFSDDAAGSFEAFEEMESTPLLVLDDLDSQTSIAWVRDRLFQLLDHRHTARLPTVITTALSLDDLGERLASRLVDPAVCSVIVLGEQRRDSAPPARRGRKAAGK